MVLPGVVPYSIPAQGNKANNRRKCHYGNTESFESLTSTGYSYILNERDYLTA